MSKARIQQTGETWDTWQDRLQKPEAALKKIGALMLAASQKAFREQKFGKIVWKPRKVPNTFGIITDFSKSGNSKPPKRRFEASPVLINTGQLRRTINFALVGKDAVEVGSNLPYAGTHNFGGPIESLPLTKSVQEKLLKWLGSKAGQPWQSKLIFLTLPGMTNQKLKGKAPARPFVGLTPKLIEEIEKWVGLKVFTDR